jgi:hypothetical protein
MTKQVKNKPNLSLGLAMIILLPLESKVYLILIFPLQSFLNLDLHNARYRKV